MRRDIIFATAILSGGSMFKRPMKLFIILLASVTVGIAFSGCAARYGCPVPGGIQCRSISEVYSGTKTAQPMDKGPGKTEKDRGNASKPAASVTESIAGVTPDTAIPLRSAPKVLRVWVAPWIDREGDLHQKSYLYVVVDTGQWAIGIPAVESDPAPAIKGTDDARPGGAPDLKSKESPINGK